MSLQQGCIFPSFQNIYIAFINVIIKLWEGEGVDLCSHGDKSELFEEWKQDITT